MKLLREATKHSFNPFLHFHIEENGSNFYFTFDGESKVQKDNCDGMGVTNTSPYSDPFWLPFSEEYMIEKVSCHLNLVLLENGDFGSEKLLIWFKQKTIRSCSAVLLQSINGQGYMVLKVLGLWVGRKPKLKQRHMYQRRKLEDEFF